MVAKDFNHPEVVLYSIGNEILEVGTDAGAAWGRRLADAIRSRDDTRLVTSGVQRLFAVRDQLAEGGASRRSRRGRGQHADDPDGRSHDDDAMHSELVDERTADFAPCSTSPGSTTSRARYDIDRELFPNR